MDKRVAIVMSLLFFAAVTVFWSVFCPGYLCNQEWFQLFQFTPEYFRDLVLTPGGLAAWAGRFLMQFYYYPPAGGAVIAAVLTGILLLCFSLSAERSSFSFALSLAAACIFFVNCCSSKAFLTPAVSCLLCLSSAALLSGTSKPVQVLATPAVWFLFGPFAVIYVSACIFRDGKIRLVPALIQILLTVALPALFSLFVPYQFKNLLLGIYSSRYMWTTPVLAWMACAFTVAAVAVLSRHVRPYMIAAVAAYALCAALAVWGVKIVDFRLEKLLEYGLLSEKEDWGAITDKALSDPVTSADVHLEAEEDGDRWVINDSYTLEYSTIALACARQGRLVENLFSRFCPGPEGLFPKYDQNSELKDVYVSDVYYQLAMTSFSQEQMFESKETVPDKQKGARAYTRLACTNSINGDFAVSDKYLGALSHSLFRSSFARSFDHSDPQLEQYRRFRYRGRPYPINYDNMLSALSELVTQCPDNRMAAQYLVALTLLKKELRYLNQVVSMVYPGDTLVCPDQVQQALMVKLVSEESFDGRVPSYISGENVRKGVAFMEEYEKLGSLSGGRRRSAVNALRRKFGDTYYFFHYLQ